MMERPGKTKKAVNLTLDAELIAEAKAFGTNLSQVLDTAVREVHREQRALKWWNDNKAAIEASNAELEKNGMWYTPDWLRK